MPVFHCLQMVLTTGGNGIVLLSQSTQTDKWSLAPGRPRLVPLILFSIFLSLLLFSCLLHLAVPMLEVSCEGYTLLVHGSPVPYSRTRWSRMFASF